MKPSQIPLPLGALPRPSRQIVPLPARSPRETPEPSDGARTIRFYREIQHDLEHFFRRLEKPFRGTE